MIERWHVWLALAALLALLPIAGAWWLDRRARRVRSAPRVEHLPKLVSGVRRMEVR